MLAVVTGDTAQDIAAFALAAIPGVLTLEMLEYGRPRLRERGGVRAAATYMLLSLLAWAVAASSLDAGSRLGEVIDTAHAPGVVRVEAFAALAWRILAAAVVAGLALRLTLWLAGWFARKVDEKRRRGSLWAYGWAGDLVTELVSFAYGWDRLIERLRRAGRPQVVHIRFRDGTEMYGVLAARGNADFEADGRGLVLDAELIEADGELVQIEGSSGVFVAGDAVASVAFIDYTTATSSPSTIKPR